MTLGAFSTVCLLLLAIVALFRERTATSVALSSGALLLAFLELVTSLAADGRIASVGTMRALVVLDALAPVLLLIYGVTWSKGAAADPWRLPHAVLVSAGLLFAAGAAYFPLDLLLHMTAPVRGLAAAYSLGTVGYWLYVGLLIICLISLVNLEGIYSAMRGRDRWLVKYELYGIGCLLAACVFHYSQVLFYRGVQWDLVPIRSGMFIVGALLVGHSRLFRGQSRKVVVSRQLFHRSFTLIGAGLYLLILGLLGQGAKYFHLPMNQLLLFSLALLGGAIFLVLLASGKVHGRVKVFIAKHFYAQKHDYREAWLGFSDALASCRGLDDVQETIVETYTRAFDLRSAALYLRKEARGRYALACASGWEGLPDSLESSPGLLGYFTRTGRVLNPGDGEYAATQEEVDFLRAAGAWLVVPLMAGARVEALAVLGAQVVPQRLIYEDYDLMKIIGRQAALSLSNFRLSEELAENRELAAMAKVSSFVAHDLKNLAYGFSLMLRNAEEHLSERDFQRDLVDSIRGAVARMSGMIGRLKTVPQKHELLAEFADVSLLARETVAEMRKLKAVISFREEYASAEAGIDVRQMKDVLLNLLLNACDAVGRGGAITVRTGRRNGEIFLAVEDSGPGMTRDFIESQLFRPFRTTKEKGLGIGLYQCKQIVEAHGGTIEVESHEGEGTVFTVVLPGGRLPPGQDGSR